MRLGIISPLWQRRDLTRLFLGQIDQLAIRVGPDIELVPVALYSEGDEYLDAVRSPGTCWTFLEHVNQPLSEKLCFGMQHLGTLGVDAVLSMGSDDFVGEHSIRFVAAQIQAGYDIVGVKDFYFWNAQKGMRWWGGYKGRRAGETVGAGRSLSARLLERMDWTPWPGKLLCGMDGAMWRRLKTVPNVRALAVPATEFGPLVDVKTEVNLTSWVRLARGARVVSPLDAVEILKTVGISELANV